YIQVCGGSIIESVVLVATVNFGGDMLVLRFHCLFVGLSGCQDGGGNELINTSLIAHLRDQNCNGEAQAITKRSLLNDLAIFKRAELTLKHIGLWLCGFVIYDLAKPRVPSCSKQFDHVNDEVYDIHDGFTLVLFDSMFSKGLHNVKSIPSKCRLWFLHVLKGVLDKLLKETLAESSYTVLDVDDDDLDLGKRNIKQCKRKICDGHYTAAAKVLSSSSVAPYSEVTLEDLKT
nr:putative reverse transcriptase domain-containing protein [Tanacetum cinerariifolium]